MADLERLVHAHVQALDHFITFAFPLADCAEITDLALTGFASASRRSIHPDEQWQLLAYARRVVLRVNSARDWLQENADLIRQHLRGVFASDEDNDRQPVVTCILSATETLSTQEQFVLRLAMLYPEMTAAQLSVVLDVGADAAERLLQDSQAAFREAYRLCDPDEDEGGDAR